DRALLDQICRNASHADAQRCRHREGDNHDYEGA
ncbi:MAG: hypothetical protein ACI9AQ_001970, partial [Dinoroseobacter sp.]